MKPEPRPPIYTGFRTPPPQRTDPRIELQRASGWVAEQLHLDEGALVVSRHQQTFIDGMPWSLQTNFYPMKLVEQGAHRLIEYGSIPEGATRYLEEILAIRQGGRRDEIKTRVPDRDETDVFGLPEDSRVPVFEISRAAFDERGNPFRLTIIIYPADRIRIVYEKAKLPPVKRGGRP